MIDTYRIELKDGQYRLFRTITLPLRGTEETVSEEQMIGVFASEAEAREEIEFLGPLSYRLSAKGAFSYWMQSEAAAA